MLAELTLALASGGSGLEMFFDQFGVFAVPVLNSDVTNAVIFFFFNLE